MKKVLSYFFILFGIGLMAASTHKGLMGRISAYRTDLKGPLGEHNSPAGDLVRMSYLDNVPKYFEKRSYAFKKNPDSVPRNIDLYFLGDSYTMSIPDSAYAHINKFAFGRRGFFNLTYDKLDSSKRNILLVEITERFVRTWFEQPKIFSCVVRKSDAVVSGKPPGLMSRILDRFFNEKINQNLEYNMFNYNFINWIRQMKAEMNYSLFHRVSGDVALSDDGEYVFIRQTVELSDKQSSYKKIEKEELLNIVKTIDTAYRHYKNEGFQEIYFSFIPNSATILQPQNYNELIPALEKELSKAGIPFIPIYDQFKSHPSPATLFRVGDTHWNNNGCQMWLQAVNQTLIKESKQHAGS